jgi:hypothetical protein
MTIRILPPSRAFAAAAAFLLAAPAPAQDIAPLRGEWTGEVTETVEGETTRYRMHVSIDADHGGRPVASVAYSLECRGVWTGASLRGRAWHFAETITAGRAHCAPHVEVELVPEGDALHVRLHPVFVPEQLAQATLRRAR